MTKTQRTVLSALILLISLTALVLSCNGLAKASRNSRLIDELKQENQALTARLGEVSTQLDQFITVATLKDWSLEAMPWADSTGADVTFRAVPSDFRPGVSATLLIMLDGKQVSSTPCIWDGTAFTATAPVDAADGYSYYCLLDSPGGIQQLTLATPDSPDTGIAVYLQSGMHTFCNLVITDWTEAPGSLVLSSAYAQVQLPQVSAKGSVQISTTELVLRLNGEICTQVPITLNPSEVSGSFDSTLTDLELTMPNIGYSDSLELYLEVVLSDGRHLQAFGISWYRENGKLQSAVG